MNMEYIKYKKVSSTMDIAEEKIRQGIYEDTVIIADEQTNGVGTRQRKFISPNNGIYFTIIPKRILKYQNSLISTLIAAVAVVKSIEETYSKRLNIKWINDIYMDDYKVGGILTRSIVDSNKNNQIYVGIGINISENREFDLINDNKVTGIFDRIVTRNERYSLIYKIVEKYIKLYENIDKELIEKEYNKYLYYKNKHVMVNINNEYFVNGVICGVDVERGIIIDIQGEIRFFKEVKIKY